MTFNCKQCNKEFYRKPYHVKRGCGKFCSNKCKNEHRKQNPKTKEPNVSCAFCGKEFYKSLSKQKYSKSGLYFCNKACKCAAQRIGGIEEIQPDHYGKTVKNYRDIAFRNLPNKCDACSYDKIKEILHVHHKDKNRSNNELNNLQILCPNCHEEFHYLDRSGKWRIGESNA